MKSNFYIGWDVGGWNCDKNSKSRDAIVILDDALDIVGSPWRGNLREYINYSSSSREWVAALFKICRAESHSEDYNAVMGIDIPLGFSQEFTNLITNMNYTEPVCVNSENPYLYRQTERYLFRHGINPLSSIKDMIGSQTTKGMHVLAKFTPHIVECGVWSDNTCLTAIEAYPSPCKNSQLIKQLKSKYVSLGNDDKNDALACALLACLFATNRDKLAIPSSDTPISEGWIWLPKDVVEN